MVGLKKEYVLYGLNNYHSIIDSIIEELHAEQYEFDIKLMLTESISNAFLHGNKHDVSKPIYIRCHYEGSMLQFEIQDCGVGEKNIKIPMEIHDLQVLSEAGRGLYLIACVADYLDFVDNVCIIRKKLN